MFCISETWLNENHSDQSLELTFFNNPAFRYDRTDRNKTGGGGSAVYCKFGLDCTQLIELEELFPAVIDSVWIKIKTNSKTIVLGSIYKPAKVNNNLLINSLEEVLLHPSTQQSEVIIVGDAYINWLRNSPEKRNMNALLINFNMAQLINGTTRAVA